MNAILGKSWVTSLVGYIIGVLIIVKEGLDSGQVLPTTTNGWITYIVGIALAVLGRASKQSNITNSPNPAEQVSTKALELPSNPAAPVK